MEEKTHMRTDTADAAVKVVSSSHKRSARIQYLVTLSDTRAAGKKTHDHENEKRLWIVMHTQYSIIHTSLCIPARVRTHTTDMQC